MTCVAHQKHITAVHPPAHQVHTNEHNKGVDAVDVEFDVQFDVEFDVVDVSYPVVPLMGRWAPSAPIRAFGA